MTTHDDSQLPIERLAQLLLECARTDDALPRRTPANDDERHAQSIDDMYNRIEALPELRRETRALLPDPPVSLPDVPAEFASNEDLEELVALALTSAHDAEDVSRVAHEASRKARLGTWVAAGLAALGVAVGGASVIAARLHGADSQQMAEMTQQVKSLRDLQHRINEQLAEMQAQRVAHEAAVHEANVREASADQPGAVPSRPADAVTPVTATLANAEGVKAVGVKPPPMKATAVRVLPAEPAAPLPPDDPPTQSAAQMTYAPGPGYAAYPPAEPPPSYDPPAVYVRPWPTYHAPQRYRARFVLPRPVGYVIVSVRRDVRALFR